MFGFNVSNGLNTTAIVIDDASIITILVFLIAPILVFFFHLIIMRFWYKYPIHPNKLLGGLTQRLPHRFEDLSENKKSKYDGEKNESLSKLWRMIMIDGQSQPEHEDPKDKKSAKIVYGECTDTVTIEHALYKGLTVELIFGRQIRDEKSQKRLAYLKEKYGNQLNIYSAKERPPRHAAKIGNNILMEDFHLINDEYNASTSILDASKQAITSFNKYFDDLKSCESTLKLLTYEDVLRLRTLETSNLNKLQLVNSTSMNNSDLYAK
jgi:hypothetical protein